MYNFNYHHPKTLQEAIDIHKSVEFPKYLAGGMTIIPSLKQKLSSPSDLIDLQHIKNLKGISIRNNEIEVGALCTHNEIAHSNIIKQNIFGLAYLAANIADNAVRNLGTIGGSVSNSDPAADYPAALLALNANINTNKRTIKSEDFFVDMFETVLDENEIVVSIRLPITKNTQYIKYSSQASKYAIVGIFSSYNNKKLKLAVTGVANKVFSIDELNELSYQELNKIDLNTLNLKKFNINSDIHASSSYRISLIKSFIRKIIEDIASYE